MAAKWKPDLKALELLEKQTAMHPSHRIAAGTRVLDWADVLDEVKRGTKFGRRYQEALLESIRAAR